MLNIKQKIIFILLTITTVITPNLFIDASAQEDNVGNYPNYKRMQWGLEALSLSGLFDKGYTGEGVVVAVIDTGVDYRTQNLEGNLLEGYSELTKSSMDKKDNYDSVGHGTHVAGIIAGTGIKNYPLGVAPKSKILPIQVLSESGGTDKDIAAGIDYAVSHGARVINLSLGGEVNPFTDSTPSTCKSIEKAVTENVIVVVASGNSKQEGNPLNQPASCPGAISVGAVGRELSSTNFSSFDSTLFISSPGAEIISSTISSPDLVGEEEPSRFESWSGTSMATPFISGLVALYLEKNPNATVEDVRNALENSAIDLGPTGRDAYTGYGIPDARVLLGLEKEKNSIGTLQKRIANYGSVTISDPIYMGSKLEFDLVPPPGKFISGVVTIRYNNNKILERKITVSTGQKTIYKIDNPKDIISVFVTLTGKDQLKYYSNINYYITDGRPVPASKIIDDLKLGKISYEKDGLSIKYTLDKKSPPDLSLIVYNDDIDVIEQIEFKDEGKGSYYYKIKNKELFNHALMISLSSKNSTKTDLLSPRYYISLSKSNVGGKSLIEVNASFLCIIDPKLCKNSKINLIQGGKVIKSIPISKLGEGLFTLNGDVKNIYAQLGTYKSGVIL